MITLYNYEVNTGQYLSQSAAALDPLEKKPLIPAFATPKKPPTAKKNKVAVFNDDAWSLVPDHRGTEYWHEDGTKHSITEVGEAVPEGALLEAPVILPTDEELAAAARAKRDALLNDMSWRYERYASETRLGLPTTDAIEALDEYAQALRNITKKAKFPKKVKWPKVPA